MGGKGKLGREEEKCMNGKIVFRRKENKTAMKNCKYWLQSIHE